MVYFNTPAKYDAASLISRCLAKGLLLGAAGVNRIRMVTHIGLDEKSVRRSAEIIGEAIGL
jgi:4-aminobutyrate aminotransferase-like enzyme